MRLGRSASLRVLWQDKRRLLANNRRRGSINHTSAAAPEKEVALKDLAQWAVQKQRGASRREQPHHPANSLISVPRSAVLARQRASGQQLATRGGYSARLVRPRGITGKKVTRSHAASWSSGACDQEDYDRKGARRERPNWGLA